MKPFLLIIACAMSLSACMAGTAPSASQTASPPQQRSEKAGGLRVTFLGVSTLLFDDGETAIMTDGFFSRPAQSELAGQIGPNESRIDRALQRAGVRSLAAVIPVHSHYDHALDSPVVAAKTGALLLGSESTANIARGYRFPEDRIRVVGNGQSMRFGRFTVTMINSAHLPTGFAPGNITEPLEPPSKITDYKLGECYSVLVEHDGRAILVQGSAGFIPGALKDRRADVVYLGIGGLAGTKADYQQEYWHEIVQAVRPKRIIPVHWDNFFKPLDEPLQREPGFDASLRFVRERAAADKVDVQVQEAWQPIDPFSGL
ncbi:MBL fold metallo-hydrolase [Noviherbaspirillum galbum]|uniref:MBL fold metallo-hydrolase n=1 Tax=Noviherbaspirillum galbum TaxID=2709383 RepID=A0A6B3SNW2_9BURK|nr:MBL fold metallo-hydrolase [Noviherbaspirillum galbum]NEX62381.1 MBL fold metallo-hydrolase [Noviherbaspirillum galbum]